MNRISKGHIGYKANITRAPYAGISLYLCLYPKPLLQPWYSPTEHILAQNAYLQYVFLLLNLLCVPIPGPKQLFWVQAQGKADTMPSAGMSSLQPSSCSRTLASGIPPTAK
ncbi:hypothetical protein XENTR_v10024681 [Xenopus tropicalis]|nr:hypothetical protein XENTR_v10024681 [Xenopus tropicalis]